MTGRTRAGSGRRWLPRFLSIRSRLIAVIVGCVLSAVTVNLAAITWRDSQAYTKQKTQQLQSTATVIATSVAAHVSEKNTGKVQQSLSALARIDDVNIARVFDNRGKIVAQIGTSVVLSASGKPIRATESSNELSLTDILSGSALSVSVPIIYGGVSQGVVEIIASTQPLRDLLWENVTATLLIALLGIILAVALALWLQRSISRPIMTLKQAMSEIETTHDYQSRVELMRADEIGSLAGAFNSLLENICVRDQKISDYRTGLERKVKERTAALKEAKDEAVAANAAKSDFLATMSHEIRTPMNGVLVMAELLAASELDDRQSRLANVISRSGKSLLAIINDILDLSKIEAGQLELENVPFSPRELVDDIMQLYWDKAREKGLGLAAAVHPSIPETVIGDPIRLTQILSNLVNNAIKFTTDGHVVVSLSGGLSKSNPTRLRLRACVSDTGIGIPQDKKNSIFEQFSQADQSTTRKFGGTGLGLTICRRLATAMNGTIGVRSRLEFGSVFAFSVDLEMPSETSSAVNQPVDKTILRHDFADDPATTWALNRIIRHQRSGSHPDSGNTAMPAVLLTRKPSADVREQEQVLLTDIGDSTPDKLIASGQISGILLRPVTPFAVYRMLEAMQDKSNRAGAARDGVDKKVCNFEGARVLVADDSPVNREVVIEAMARLHIEVDTVTNGREALECFDPAIHDLVLMDCSMPEVDGFEATEKIREQEKSYGWQRTPIVAMTAHVAGNVEEQWRLSGMDAYLAKPYTLQALSDVLSKWLPSKEVAEGSVDTRPERPRPEDAEASNFSECLPDLDNGCADVLDKRTLAQLRDVQGTGLVTRIVNLYEMHAPQALEHLRETSNSGASKEIAAAAHALKSLSLSVGAVGVATLCGQLEAKSGSGELDDIGPDLTLIENALENALRVLPNVLEDMTSKISA